MIEYLFLIVLWYACIKFIGAANKLVNELLELRTQRRETKNKDKNKDKNGSN